MTSTESRLRPASSTHFEEYHEGDRTLVCIQHGTTCAVLVEVEGTPDQKESIARQSEKAIMTMDAFFGGNFAKLFAGTLVRYSESVEGGGQALHEQWIIEMNTPKMSMSLVDAEGLLVRQGILHDGDWTNAADKDGAHAPASTAFYNLIHEFAHLMDERTDPSGPWIGIPTSHSPTMYGGTKPNEAFAEAFTYLVLGASLPEETKKVVLEKVNKFVKQKIIS